MDALDRLRAKTDPMFVRQDWELFLNPNTLGQKAGCSRSELRRVAIKEIVDNALDVSDDVTITEVDTDTVTVTDAGPGMVAEQIAELFSVNRPMTTSKLWRLPTRGTLGNGLRVVVGAAHASGGSLYVEGRGQRHEITVVAGGKTVLKTSPSSVNSGTSITISFDDERPVDTQMTNLAEIAIVMKGTSYAGKPSLHWYNIAVFRN